MKKNRAITLVALSIVSLTLGCSPRTYMLGTTRSGAVIPTEENTITEVVETNYIAEEEVIENRYQAAEPEVIEEPIESVVYDHSFTEIETQHVKMTSYNPFENLGNNTFSLDLALLSRGFTYPIDGNFSSGYNTVAGEGRIHSGVDLVAQVEAPIYAVFNGEVRMSKEYRDYGNVIVVRHNNGLETVYSHNSKNLVQVGEEVKSGQKIALCGRTGNATTNHLHFEVRVAGKTIDPELLLDVQSMVIQEGVLKISQDKSGNVTADLLKNNTNTLSAEELAATATTSRGIKIGDQIYDAPAQKAAPEEYHTVKSGESLWLIAKKYSTTVDELCKLNSISKSAPLYVGKKLRVK